jgi:hypothetical protein
MNRIPSQPMTLSNQTQHLIDTLRDPSSNENDARAAAQALFDAIEPAGEAEANTTLARFAPHLLMEKPERALFLAMVCGAMVEHGCDSEPLVQPLHERLRSLLEASARLAEACRALMPEADVENEDEGEDDEEDATEVFENLREEVAREMPAEDAAWDALDGFWGLAIAVYSVNPAARMAARDLLGHARSIAQFHEGGHWLALILSVLDNEPVLVIEPETQSGIRGRISGVVDNFQLNVLLMDAFPRSGMLSRRRVPKRVAEVARGEGPQQTDDTVTGVWNLYSWTAIDEGLKLPDPKDHSPRDTWIWNEGMPADIPTFEGQRVILLGPASYARTWQSQRMFDQLPASLEIEAELSKSEVTDWLQRMAVARDSR